MEEEVKEKLDQKMQELEKGRLEEIVRRIAKDKLAQARMQRRMEAQSDVLKLERMQLQV